MASYNASRPGTVTSCSKETRVEVLQEIDEWIANPEAGRIYWLAERAGFGKTAIALSVAERAATRGDLAASFFFSHQVVPDLSTASRFFSTLAFHLALFDKQLYRKRFAEAAKESPDVGAIKLGPQAEALFVKPLQQAPQPSRPLVIVVDALDECDRTHAQELVALLTKASRDLSLPIRLFITSRPEHHIITAFQAVGISPRTAFDTSKRDVETYLRKELPDIPEKLGLGDASDWISEEEIALLISRAGGLFVYAVVIIRFIEDSDALDPRQQLDVLLQEDEAQSAEYKPYEALDNLYLRVLAVATGNKPHLIKEVRIVLGITIVIAEQLPLSWLKYFAAPAVKNIHRTLNKLRSVIALDLSSDQGISFHHASFKDFLLDSSRSSTIYFIDRPSIHHHLAQRFMHAATSSPHGHELDLAMTLDTQDDVLGPDRNGTPGLQHILSTVFSHIANASKDATLIDKFDAFFSQASLWWTEYYGPRYKNGDIVASYAWRASGILKSMALANYVYYLLGQ